LKRKKGTILLTGATASWRGSSGLAAFSVGKFGLRALGQALAREYGPKGIHVCHIVVDAVVDMPFTRPFVEKKFSDGVVPKGILLEPVELAEQYWNIHQQPPSVWTQELDVRPLNEPIAGRL